MATMNRAPKPWALTEDETLSSFTSWVNRVLYYLRQDTKFSKYLETTPPATWDKKTAANPKRGFTDDDDLAEVGALSGDDKVQRLEDMLGLISQFAPPLLANDIINNSTSLDSIWQKIRKYFNIKQSETQFMKLYSIQWEADERPEKLYQRILAHLQDNLLSTSSTLLYDSAKVTTNEDMSPTLERWAVLHWMHLIHPGLPALVQRSFAYDLQRMTLKDLQPQICDSIQDFLQTLKDEDVKVARMNSRVPFRSQGKPQAQRNPRYGSTGSKFRPPRPPKKECRVCKSEGRQHFGHNISECDYISKGERRDLLRACRTEIQDDASEDLANDFDENVVLEEQE